MVAYNLRLNFIPLANSDFQIECYRKRVESESEERPAFEVAQYALPPSRSDGKWPKYWIGTEAREGWEHCVFHARDNHAAALWILNKILLTDFRKHILDTRLNCQVDLTGGHFPGLDIKLKQHPEGWQGIHFELKYLKAEHQLGALVNFHFFANSDNEHLDRHKILALSFSCDGNGRSNKNYFVDRYRWESAFVRKILSAYKLAPNEVIPQGLAFQSVFSSVPAYTLPSRQYDFGNGGTGNAQYWGILKFGPCRVPTVFPKFYFLYRKQDKPVAVSLFKALAGKTYPARFPGMEQMFRVPFSGSSISSCELDDFSFSSMMKAAETIKGHNDPNAICIALADDTATTYYAQKAAFLKLGIATQNVKLKSVVRSREFEWFVAGIGLQVFCKAKGLPWKVKSNNKKTLIVGISQAFGIGCDGAKRYISYSVTTDASGEFKDIQTLADSETDRNYIERLAENLQDKLLGMSEGKDGVVDRIVLHCSFKLPIAAMQRIRSVVEKIAGNDNAPQIVVLRINSDHEYSGYDMSQASLVPRECSYVSLGGDKYVLWCDGVKPNKSIAKRPCAPIHVCFDQACPPVTQADKIAILGDVSNLAGANWRGFNASTQPVSVFYCKLVGEFIREFSERGLPVPSVEEFMPWFL